MRPRGAGRAMAALAATILAMVPLAAAHADAAAAEAAIRQRLVAWRDAFNAGDAAAACDLFAPDLVYALPDVPDGTQASMCRNLKRVLARKRSIVAGQIDLRAALAAPDFRRWDGLVTAPNRRCRSGAGPPPSRASSAITATRSRRSASSPPSGGASSTCPR